MTDKFISNKNKTGYFRRLYKDIHKNALIYLMVTPVVVYYIIFQYIPMYGIQIAFKDFSLGKGYLGSPWVGFKHFMVFFKGYFFSRTVINTLLINIYGLMFSFPAPIIFALLLNEARIKFFKKTVQTFSYLPHFISLVVICGMITQFSMSDGLINDVVALFGGERSPLLYYAKNFRTIYIASGIWQGLGWSSIIYIAAISAVDQELYESAIIDGAGRFKRMWHITLPGIKPTIVILLIMNIGGMMSVGADKIILLYQPSTYAVADVISSYVYRMGLQRMDWSYGAAVGLFNSVINMFLLIIANQTSRRVSETSLW